MKIKIAIKHIQCAYGYKKSKTAFFSLIKDAPKILINVQIKVKKQSNVLLINA